MVAVNLEAIWFEFWMKRVSVTLEIFVFCGWWFSNQFDIVGDTFYCDTIGRELQLAIICSLLCPETDIRIGKQGYVFILTDFKKWCFDISFLTCICVSTVILRLRKVDFFNKLISEIFCLLGLLNSRQSNGSWLTKTNFVLDLVSLAVSLDSLSTETSRGFFSEPFSKRNSLKTHCHLPWCIAFAFIVSGTQNWSRY